MPMRLIVSPIVLILGVLSTLDWIFRGSKAIGSPLNVFAWGLTRKFQ